MVQTTYFRTNADNMQANLTNQLLEVRDTSQQGQADCYLSLSDSLYGIQAEIYAIAKNLPSTGTVSLLLASFIYKNDWTSAGDFILDYDCDTNEFVATFNKQTSSGTETTTNRYSVSDVITANREFEIYLTFMNNDGYFDINRELDKPKAYSFDSPVYISLIQLRSNTQSEELVYRLDSSFEFEGESPASFTLLDMFPPVMSGSTNAKFTAASEPVLETVDVTPSTEYQDITPDSGVDGFSQVHVSAVENVLPSNIKLGASILGVNGTVVEKIGENKTDLIASSTSLPITFTPSAGYNCMDSFTLTSIQSLEPFNIRSGTTIAGVTGTLNEFRPTQKSITIATDATFPVTYYPEGSANGFSEFGINGITNLEASNIKEGVTIAGVTGNVVEANLTSYSTMLVSGSTFPWTITPDSPYNGFSEVSIAGIDYLEPENIKAGVTICDVTGTYSPTLVTKTITQNGTYSASSDSADGYSSVTVNVSGGGSSKYGVSMDNIIGNVDSNGVLSSPSSINGITFTGVTEIGNYALKNAFFESGRIFGLVAFPDLTTVGTDGLYSAFYNNNQITSVDLPNLTIIGNNGLYSAFQYCQITSVDLPNLTTVGESGLNTAFYGNKITSVNLSSLTTVGSNGLAGAFADNKDSQGQTTLTSISFPALTSQSFGESTNQFNDMLSGDEGVTVHFPSNLQSVIGDWDNVTNGFGGTNTTVLFDLPATE